MTTNKHDVIDHPSHYMQGKIEVIDVIEDWKMGFCDGNAIKYIARHKYKNNPIEDLKKARWYIDRLIKTLQDEKDDVIFKEIVTTQNKKIITVKINSCDRCGTDLGEFDKCKLCYYCDRQLEKQIKSIKKKRTRFKIKDKSEIINEV